MYALGGKSRSSSQAVNNPTWSVDVLTNGYADNFLGDSHDIFFRSTSGGHVKFYPNAFTSSVMADSEAQVALQQPAEIHSTFNRESPELLAFASHKDGTTGGMCVRAVLNSYVDSNLVNFYMNVPPKDVSGSHFNLKGLGCEYVEDQGGDNNGVPNPGTEVTSLGGDYINPGGITTLNGGETNTGIKPGGSYSTQRWDPADANLVGYSLNWWGGTTIGSFWSPMAPVGSTGQFGITNATMAGTVGSQRDNGPRRRMYGYNDFEGDLNIDFANYAPSCMGSKIHIWNIADTSRIHATNCLVNNSDPETFCSGVGYHGPGGKWFNGAALDYYGAGGRRSTYGALGNTFANTGIYRLMLSTRGDVKTYFGLSSLSGTTDIWMATDLSGGWAYDQINGAGYQDLNQCVMPLAYDERRITGTDADYVQGIYQTSGAQRVFGWGNPAPAIASGVGEMQPRMGAVSAFYASATLGGYALSPEDSWVEQTLSPQFPIPPLHMDWQGYMRNWFDETASNTWQNVKHMAEDKVNAVSIYRSIMNAYQGGEGRDGGADDVSFGCGVRSLNLFDMDRLL
jgi:hypothetical protein